ncbi:MAG: hypothetical protein QOI90_550 [Mycobacterium sp.]|nr:hypothetical protein [Mycobacterium sp.]
MWVSGRQHCGDVSAGEPLKPEVIAHLHTRWVSIRDEQTRFDGPDTRGAAVEIMEVAAVVPAPEPPRLTVPKAYVSLAAGWAPIGPPPKQSSPMRIAAEDDLGQDPAGRAAGARKLLPARCFRGRAPRPVKATAGRAAMLTGLCGAKELTQVFAGSQVK